MLKLANNDIKTAIITISHMFKKLNRYMDDSCFKNWTSRNENYNVWDEINDRLGTVEENVSEFEGIAIETI